MITVLMFLVGIAALAAWACSREDGKERKEAELRIEEQRKERAREFGARIGRALRK